MTYKKELENKKVKRIVKVKQITTETKLQVDKVYSSNTLGEMLSVEIGDDTQESLLLICLNNQMDITYYGKVFTGSINTSTVSPRDIFQRALLSNARYIIVAHNHPSGNLTPSENDIKFTKRLQGAGAIMDMPLMDAFIISGKEAVSFREEKIIA